MQLFIGNLISENTIELTEEETFHCIKVLRKKAGDELWVTDGKGMLYHTKIITVSSKKITLECISKVVKENKREYRLHIAIAPTKNIDRVEWFVEKATELGIDELSFIICNNSERRIIKTDRISKLIESACKQSLKFTFPVVNDPLSFESFIISEKLKQSSLYIAHCRSNQLPFLGKLITGSSNATVLIGPEGDFDEEEIRIAKTNFFKEVSLGSARLRTETAALSVVHSFSFLNNLSL